MHANGRTKALGMCLPHFRKLTNAGSNPDGVNYATRYLAALRKPL